MHGIWPHENMRYKRVRELSRGVRRVTRKIDASGYGDWVEVAFERTILHGLDFHGRAAILVGDEEIWSSSEYNDHYGIHGMVDELSLDAAGARRKFKAIRDGIRVVLSIGVCDRFHDLIERAEEFRKDSVEMAVATAPREWNIEGVEPLFDSNGRIFEIAAADDAECAAFLETLSKVLSGEALASARTAIAGFFSAYDEAGRTEAA